jgi:hypothetical protein
MSVKCHAFLLLVRNNSETDKVMVEDAAFTGQNVDRKKIARYLHKDCYAANFCTLNLESVMAKGSLYIVEKRHTK